jgi:hypothetical protein
LLKNAHLAALPSFFVIAAYIQVRLIPQSRQGGIREPLLWTFLSNLKKTTFSVAF